MENRFRFSRIKDSGCERRCGKPESFTQAEAGKRRKNGNPADIFTPYAGKTGPDIPENGKTRCFCRNAFHRIHRHSQAVDRKLWKSGGLYFSASSARFFRK